MKILMPDGTLETISCELVTLCTGYNINLHELVDIVDSTESNVMSIDNLKTIVKTLKE